MSVYERLMREAAALNSVQGAESNMLLSRAEAVGQRRREIAAELEANKNSLVSQAGLDLDS